MGKDDAKKANDNIRKKKKKKKAKEICSIEKLAKEIGQETINESDKIHKHRKRKHRDEKITNTSLSKSYHCEDEENKLKIKKKKITKKERNYEEIDNALPCEADNSVNIDNHDVNGRKRKLKEEKGGKYEHPDEKPDFINHKKTKKKKKKRNTENVDFVPEINEPSAASKEGRTHKIKQVIPEDDYGEINISAEKRKKKNKQKEYHNDSADVSDCSERDESEYKRTKKNRHDKYKRGKDKTLLSEDVVEITITKDKEQKHKKKKKKKKREQTDEIQCVGNQQDCDLKIKSKTNEMTKTDCDTKKRKNKSMENCNNKHLKDPLGKNHIIPKSENTETEPTEHITGQETTGQWVTAEFSDKVRQSKFLRLLGGCKNKDSKKEESNGNSNKKLFGGLAVMAQQGGKNAMNSNQQVIWQSNMENQYEKALGFRKARGMGLGFEKPPEEGKKFHINISSSKSIKFDD